MPHTPGDLTRQIHGTLLAAGKMKPPAPSAQDRLRQAEADHKRPEAAQPADAVADAPWRGTFAKKPWHYRVTAVVPHRGALERLERCLRFIARQSEQPYVMLIDTDGDDESFARVRALRSEAIEIHRVACHATEEYADAACFAMDLAMSACRTEYLWCLPSDCFVVNSNMLAQMLAMADDGRRPVIGYESLSAAEHPECQGMVSEACTLLHMPTMRRFDVTWSRAGLAARAASAGQIAGLCPEISLNYRFRERGIEPLLLGSEHAAGIEREGNDACLRPAVSELRIVTGMPRTKEANGKGRQEPRSLKQIPSHNATVAVTRPLTKPTAFQLLYHVTPLATNDVWRRNVSLLLRYMHVFNSKKIVAIAQGNHGDPIYPANEVERLFAGHDVDFIHLPNDPDIRESASLQSLLEKGFSTSPNVATFYAHTKGLAHPRNRAVTMWYRSMYTNCLGNIERVAEALSRVSCCGAFRRIGPHRHFPTYSHWHFSGTFFWFRNSRLYSHPRWREVDNTRYGAEAYPSKLFRLEDSECLFCDDAGDLYDVAYWNAVVIPTAYMDSIRP